MVSKHIKICIIYTVHTLDPPRGYFPLSELVQLSLWYSTPKGLGFSRAQACTFLLRLLLAVLWLETWSFVQKSVINLIPYPENDSKIPSSSWPSPQKFRKHVKTPNISATCGGPSWPCLASLLPRPRPSPTPWALLRPWSRSIRTSAPSPSRSCRHPRTA